MTSRDGVSPAGTVFKVLVTLAGVLCSAYLLWGMRSLIVPVTVGGMMAYICRPLIAHLEHYRIPRGLAIGLLLVVFVVAVVSIAGVIRAMVPSESRAIELRVEVLYKLNESYDRMMGLNASQGRGNRLYRLSYEELNPVMARINRLLALTREEESQFLASRPRGAHAPNGSDRLLDYHRANLRTLKVRAPDALPETGGVFRRAPASPVQAPHPDLSKPLAMLGHILSAWIIAPLVFLFLLRDTGEIKRGLLSSVPNRLFEPALMVLSDLDRALGDYVRAVFLECVALGFTTIALLALVGVAPRWAIAIGTFTAATNVIPYLGSAAALVGGLTYALLAEEIHPPLPMVTTSNLAFWVVAAVAVAEVLKNILYEPLVLGGGVKLHPFVVVIGVAGGGILFDFAGMLLAIPVITVSKVFVSSTVRHLKAYGLL